METINTQDLQSQIRFISHEIRNHLSICDMYSQIIKRNLEKDGIKNPSIENALDCIQKSVQIIGANLLDLKSINNNSDKVMDFEKTVIMAFDMAKAYVEDKNIKFEIFIKNSANIFVDECRFISCIVNILKNAIEAVDIKGEINIIGDVKDKIAILKISNNGKPIPKDKQNTIFDCGYTTKKSGCGLGLGICKKYLESQKSTLNLIKSTKSETQFEIRVPIYEY